jgi:acyl-CoA dehydrogenase
MDPSLPGMQPAERTAIYREMNRVIAALHRFDFAAAGLGDYGRPGNYRQREPVRTLDVTLPVPVPTICQCQYGDSR